MPLEAVRWCSRYVLMSRDHTVRPTKAKLRIDTADEWPPSACDGTVWAFGGDLHSEV